MELRSVPFGEFCASGAFFFGILLSLQVWPFGSKIQNLLQRHNPKKTKPQIRTLKIQLANRITGIIHNLIQIPFAVYLLTDPVVSGDRLYGVTAASRLCMIITVGYFIVDTVICLRYLEIEGPLFLLHALASLVLYSYGAISGYLHYYGVAFLLWELSTPFVHARWFMHILHLQETKAYIINGLIMIMTFFSVRCVYGIYLTVEYWMTSEAELKLERLDGIPPGVIWFYRILNLAFDALNFFWMSKMLKKASSFVKSKKA